MKRVFSILIAMVILFSGFCVPVSAKKTTKAPVGITNTKKIDKKDKTEAEKTKTKAANEAKKAAKAEAKEQKKIAKEQEKIQKYAAEKEKSATKNTASNPKAEKKAAKKAAKLAKKNKNTKEEIAKEGTESEQPVKTKKKASKANVVGATPIERELILIEKRHLDANKKRSKLAQYLNPNLGIREVRASHILVKKRKEAVQIKKDIDSGVITFEEAVKQYSICPSSMRDGDLGYFDRKKMEPQFAETAFDLKIGEISGPVGTKFGWHIIKTTDKR